MERAEKIFYRLMAVVFVLRLLLIAFTGLTNDEAYYWLWSNHLQLSYFDHPPAIAYFLKMFTLVLGSSAFSVHFTALFFSTLFIFILFRWLKEVYGAETACFGAVTVLFTPIFFIGGTVLSPDAILGVFLVITVMSVHKALAGGKGHYWYYAGIAAGLGALTKYVMFLIPAGIFLWLIFSKTDRRWLKRKEPYIFFIIMLAAFLPVIIWNQKNGWSSFNFQFASRHLPAFSIVKPLRFIAVQLLHVSPVAYFACWVSFYKMFEKGIAPGRDRKAGYLFCVFFPLAGVFTALSFFVDVLSHWPVYGYVGALAFLPAVLKNKSRFFKVNLSASVLISAVFVFHIFYPLARITKDPTDDLYGWKQVAEEVLRIKTQLPPDSFMICDRYETGGQLSFYTKGDVYIVHNNVTPWLDPEKLKGKDALYVNHSRYFRGPQFNFRAKKFSFIKKIDIFRSGRLARTFYVYRCENFMGLKKRKKN